MSYLVIHINSFFLSQLRKVQTNTVNVIMLLAAAKPEKLAQVKGPKITNSWQSKLGMQLLTETVSLLLPLSSLAQYLNLWAN